MYCSYCGKEIDDSSKYCNFCGRRLSDCNHNTKNALVSYKHAFMIYCIWVILNVVVLASGNSCKYAKYLFFPFSLNCDGRINTCQNDNNFFASYDWTEFLSYTFLIPSIIFYIYILFKNKTAKK